MSESPPTVNTTAPDILDLAVPSRRLLFTPPGEDPPLPRAETKRDNSLSCFSALFMNDSRAGLKPGAIDIWWKTKKKKKERRNRYFHLLGGQRTNGVRMSRTPERRLKMTLDLHVLITIDIFQTASIWSCAFRVQPVFCRSAENRLELCE